ncbi:hypothetical protein ANTRET_LOCUS7211 [Anthophora retusa]
MKSSGTRVREIYNDEQPTRLDPGADGGDIRRFEIIPYVTCWQLNALTEICVTSKKSAVTYHDLLRRNPLMNIKALTPKPLFRACRF